MRLASTAGVLGSVGGGVLLDRLGSTLRMASVICGCACLLGLVALLPAFLSTTTFAGFMSAFAVGQLLIFLLQVGGCVFVCLCA